MDFRWSLFLNQVQDRLRAMTQDEDDKRGLLENLYFTGHWHIENLLEIVKLKIGKLP